MLVKICGIKTPEAALAAEEGGADFIGFIFYERSRRYIAPSEAARIRRTIKRAKVVGVFVDEAPGTIENTRALCGLDLVQLHGHEDASLAKKIHAPVIKAFRWRDDFSADEANAYPADFILLDSFSAKKVGGTGETFSWHEARDEALRLKKPLFIAGGISSENVREAESVFHPYCVDVSGSLETGGEKSPEKITRFLKIVKGQGAE